MHHLRVLGSVVLVDVDEKPVPLLGSQPKLLALLTYLALSDPARPARRDTLLNLFWPQLPEPGARHALSQALSVIRRALGPEALTGKWNESVRINPIVISCDVTLFRASLGRGDCNAAFALYKGPLLDGFHLAGCSDFERWIDHERDFLSRTARDAAAVCAVEAARAGSTPDAIMWARRAIEIDAFHEKSWRVLIEAYNAAGDRAGALAIYERLLVLLQEELGVGPDPTTVALAKTISAGAAAPVGAALVGAGAAVARSAPTERIDVESVDAKHVVAGKREPLLPPPSISVRARFWRPAFGIAAGIAAVVMAASIYLNRSRVARPLSGASIASRPLILAVPFEAEPRDSLLARAATIALRVDLAQSRAARLISDARVGSALERMRVDPARIMTPSVARELAIREGAAAVISGSILRVGKGFMLLGRATRSSDGQDLFAARHVPADSASIIAGVEVLSRQLRTGLGETRSELAVAQPLAHVTTPSLEALQFYSAAGNAQNPDAILALLEQAIARDSTFAMAYLRQAQWVYGPWGPESKRRQALARAWELRDRLPEPERSYAIASYYRLNDKKSEKALTLMLAVLAQDSTEIDASTAVTDIYMRRHDFGRAWLYASRGVASGDDYGGHYNAFVIALARGDFANAEAVLKSFRTHMPEHPFNARLRGELAAARRNYPEAIRFFEEYRALTVPGTNDHAGAYGMLIATATASGDLDRAIAYVRRDMQEEAPLGAPFLLGRAYTLANLLLRKGQAAHADAVLDTILKKYPIDLLPQADRPYSPLATYYAGRGDTARARAYLARISPDAHLHHAGMLEARRQYLEAAAYYRDVTADAPAECLSCGMYEMARMYDLAGQTDSAIAVYRRATGMIGSRTVRADAVWLQTSLPRLIQLEVQQHDTISATSHAVMFRKLYGVAMK